MGYFSGRSAGFGPMNRPRISDQSRVSSFRNRKQMSNNPDDYEALNEDVKNWAEDEKNQLKQNVPRDTGALAKSIGARVYKEHGIVRKIGFKLKRYGVFREKGVGRGRPAGSNRTKPSPWFNPVLDKGIHELADIVQTHYADITVKNIRIN